MADNDYRSYRGRAARDAGQPLHDSASDPLAELARLIGQNDPYSEANDRDRYAPADSGENAAAPGFDWSADDDYADEQPRARPEERYAQPPPVNAPQTYAPPPRGYASEPPADDRFFSGPAAQFNGFRESDNDSDYQADDAGYHDEQYPEEPPAAPGRQQTAFTPGAADDGDDRYAADPYEQGRHEQDGEYGADDYHEEPPRRRGGFVIVMAVLGLAVLGTAGAFGYRAMFGASVLPTLPPIIKAGNGPNKIMPSYGDAQPSTPSQAGAASSGSTEKLVSREEQPVDIQQPSSAPRVISTIPISPGANQATPPGMTALGAPGQTAPSAGGPWPSSAPTPAAPAQPAAPAPATAAPVPLPAPASASPEPKKVHTVTIKASQAPQSSDASAPSPSPAPAPRSTARTASAPRPSAAAAASASGAQPLSLVPNAQDDGAPLPPPPAPSRTRAMARASVASAAPAPVSAATSSSAGGYAVQVTSQRSEAEAQAAFRELRNKFPNQLAGKEAIVRRADLGAKGVYYRALVGPYASMEAATGMCSSLKAAGGTCIVQRN